MGLISRHLPAKGLQHTGGIAVTDHRIEILGFVGAGRDSGASTPPGAGEVTLRLHIEVILDLGHVGADIELVGGRKGVPVIAPELTVRSRIARVVGFLLQAQVAGHFNGFSRLVVQHRIAITVILLEGVYYCHHRLVYGKGQEGELDRIILQPHAVGLRNTDGKPLVGGIGNGGKRGLGRQREITRVGRGFVIRSLCGEFGRKRAVEGGSNSGVVHAREVALIQVGVEKVCAQFHFFEPIAPGAGIAGGNHQLHSGKQRLEFEGNLLVAGVGHGDLGGGIHIGIGHIGEILHHLAVNHLFDIFLIAGNGAGNGERMIRCVGIGYRDHRFVCRRPTLRRRIDGIEVARLVGNRPVQIVIVAAADGSRIRLAGDGTRLVGHPNNLYRLVIHRFLAILCEILLGQDTNSIGFGGNIGGAGIYIPIDPLIADAAQEDGLVVAGIGGLGGIVRAHIGFQAKAHHRVVLTGHILRLTQRRLPGTGERERKRRQGKNPFIRNTSHFLSNHYYSDPPHLPSGSQPVRW